MRNLFMIILIFLIFSGCAEKREQNTPYDNSNKVHNIILNDELVIDNRVKNKILLIANEVKEKLNINMYISIELDNHIVKNLPKEEKQKMIENYNNTLESQTKEPYVILSLSLNQHYINILSSDELISNNQRNEILGDYVIPILASKDNEPIVIKVSAAILNGFSRIANVLSERNGIKLISTNLSN